MKDEIIKIENFIKKYVANANAKGVVIGMSGGKDSLICAKLCCEALGKENVLGILMPNGANKDLNIAIDSCKELDIRYHIIDINSVYTPLIIKVKNILTQENTKITDISTINTPPRLRMTTLYAIAGSLNYLVVNTSNLSEAMIGYTTKWGDNVGDFSPIGNYTKSEVCNIGLELGLRKDLVLKTPDDGLSGISDEEKIGFTYEELDNYIRNGIKGKNFDKIARMHRISQHKRNIISKCPNNFNNYFDKK